MADIVCKDEATRKALADLLYAVSALLPTTKARANVPPRYVQLAAAFEKLYDLSLGHSEKTS